MSGFKDAQEIIKKIRDSIPEVNGFKAAYVEDADSTVGQIVLTFDVSEGSVFA